MRNRRLRRSPGCRGRGGRGPAPAGVPRVRLRRGRRRLRRRGCTWPRRPASSPTWRRCWPTTPLPRTGLGIGHTRWATHGAPNDVNAHPHTLRRRPGRAGPQRDHRELRRAARASSQRAGIAMTSRDRHRGRRPSARPSGSPRASGWTRRCARSCRRLHGAFTLVAVDAEDPDAVVAARRNSPLVVGVGDGENFVASDVAAFIEHTREAIELGQDQVVRITRGRGGGHHLRRRAGRGPALPRGLGPVGGREGRLRLVHAQGDLRAAEGGRRHPARPARRQRPADPGRDPDLRGRAAQRRQDRDRAPAARRSTPGWWPSTRSSTGPGSPARSSWPASSATATRSSARPPWWWPSASPGRRPTP